jgi:SARP family transcriptional regulator, regulator of embCAB operon
MVQELQRVSAKTAPTMAPTASPPVAGPRSAKPASARACRVVIGVQRDDVRSAVRLFVQQEPGVQVVDEAVSVQTLLRSARRLRGDLIVADTALPGMLDYAEFVRDVRSSGTRSRVVLLSTYSDSAAAELAEADAVVSMLDSPERLRSALFGRYALNTRHAA